MIIYKESVDNVDNSVNNLPGTIKNVEKKLLTKICSNYDVLKFLFVYAEA